MARLTPGHNKYFRILQKHITSGDYWVASCGDNHPSLAEIEQFERDFAVKFPEDFVDFSISRSGGVVVQVDEAIWPPPNAGEVREQWSMCRGVFVYAFAADAPDYMNIRAVTASFRKEAHVDLTPCLKVMGMADRYAFTPDGKLVYWDHDTGPTTPRAPNFLEALDVELRDLAERQRRMAANGPGSLIPPPSSNAPAYSLVERLLHKLGLRKRPN